MGETSQLGYTERPVFQVLDKSARDLSGKRVHVALISVGEPLLRIDQVAALIGIAEKTLFNWRADGRGPIGYKLGPNGPVRYRRADIDEWLEQNREVSK